MNALRRARSSRTFWEWSKFKTSPPRVAKVPLPDFGFWHDG
jgi:hypothetical protein